MKNLENEIPDITKLATNTAPNAKINETENEIPSITILATTAAPNAKIIELKVKCLILLTQLIILPLLLLKIKYLVLVIQSKKTEIEKTLLIIIMINMLPLKK